MKNIIIYTATILMSLSLWNCTGRTGSDLTPESDRKTFKEAPDWFREIPNVDGYIHTVATATSVDYQSSITKSTLESRRILGETIRSEVKGLVNRVIEETGFMDDSEYVDNFRNEAEIVTLETIELAKVIKQETADAPGNIFRSWVLLEYDQGYQQKKLLTAIKADKVLAEKLRASELLEEMEEKVEAYRKRKAQ